MDGVEMYPKSTASEHGGNAFSRVTAAKLQSLVSSE